MMCRSVSREKDFDGGAAPLENTKRYFKRERDYGRPSDWKKDNFSSRAPNMENDIEQARATNMEEDKASSAKKGKYIDVGNASDIEMATNIVENLDNEVRLISFQPNSSESRRSECCIFRVPNPLRNVNREVYAPQLISIGPLHRGNEKLKAMEKKKLKYYKKLITERNGMDEKKRCDIVISIKNQEERLRHCYSEKFKKIKSSDFATMILLDAVFIIQFFLESNDDKGLKILDPRMTYDIRQDLILLENQLPLFIIQDIYDRVNPNKQTFLDLATCYLRKHSLFKKTSSDVEKETSPGVEGSSPLHFTDLLRNLMLSGVISGPHVKHPPMLKYSAVMLHKAGVRFKVSQDSCLVNITFEKGVLKIPQLEVDHCFERLVRNIMALEQCCYPSEDHICSYIKFMDHLIDSAEDVRLLVGKGIIGHALGDDAAVSNKINSLCENIGDNHSCFDYTCFGKLSGELNAHHANLVNRAMATLKLGYFPNIWRGTATLAAATLLILTFIQTLSSVKSFY